MSIGVENMSLLHPWFLMGIPLVWILFFVKRKNIFQTQFTWSKNAVNINKTRAILAKWIDIFIPLALSFLFIALARPLLFYNEEKVKADGIDIILAMDISASMLTQDFRPDRLTVAKQIAKDFVSNRAYDRIGVVIFAGESFTQCPLTTTHDIVNGYINEIRPGILEDGTAIGMGLATSLNALKNSTSKSRIIILLTDGENNAGSISPMTAAEMATSMGVKVYTIAMGKTGIFQSPVSIGRNGEYIFAPRKLELDPSLLVDIAEKTTGKFYKAESENELKAIYDEIDQLEKTKVEINVFRRQSEHFRPFVLAGLFFLLLYFVIRFLFLKRYLQ
ncbi:MAG TPA: VWA domain-containing protein [Saprospiraceae bacterium]|nr:VWA domain-containing protein [Saprospiraceae bacterium]